MSPKHISIIPLKVSSFAFSLSLKISKVLVTLLTLRGNHILAPKYVGQLKLEPIISFHAIDGFQLFLALTL